MDTLEIILDERLKLKSRIRKHFPHVGDQLRIIANGDMNLLRKITAGTWKFSESHEPYSTHIIVLHGDTPNEAILDWAAQSVISMLILLIGVDI